MMAMDLAPRVRVNAVLPGAIETDALRRYLDVQSDDSRKVMVERTPMRRNGVAYGHRSSSAVFGFAGRVLGYGKAA
jgi:7-alpha-hydroxysteroid dehydrogenase